MSGSTGFNGLGNTYLDFYSDATNIARVTASIGANVLTAGAANYTGQYYIMAGEIKLDAPTVNATNVAVSNNITANNIIASSSSSSVNLFNNVTTGRINIGTGQIQNDLYIGTNTGTVVAGSMILGSDYNITYLGHNSPTINIGQGGGTGKTINIGTSNTTTNIRRSRFNSTSPYTYSDQLSDYHERFTGAPGTVYISLGKFYKTVHCSFTAATNVVLPHAGFCYGATIVILNHHGTNNGAATNLTVSASSGGVFAQGAGMWSTSVSISGYRNLTFMASHFNAIGAGWIVII
jgi:hypothetical protein